MQELPREQAALLRTICDNPEDDAPRLVYADWLQEEGSEANVARAEFIRLQVAAVARGSDHLGGRAMSAEELQFVSLYYSDWYTEVPRFPKARVPRDNYERGFLYEAFAKSVRSFLRAAPVLFTRVPITQVQFKSTAPKSARELARSPFLARIRCINQPHEGWDDLRLIDFASTPYLCNLQKLILGDTRITAAGLRPFLANESLTRLKFLRVHNRDGLGPGIVPAITHSPSAPVIEEIDVTRGRLGPDVAPHLPALVQLPSLKQLRLSNCNLGDEAAVCLAGITLTTSVRINLSWNRFTDRGGEVLLRGAFLRSPDVRVNLAENSFTTAMKMKLKQAFGDHVEV